MAVRGSCSLDKWGHCCCGDTVPTSAGVAVALHGCCWLAGCMSCCLHVHPTQVWRLSCEQQPCFCADTISAPQQPHSSAAAFLPWLQPLICPRLQHGCSLVPLQQDLPAMGVQAKKLMDKVLWVQALWRLRASFYLLIALCRVTVPWFPTVAVSGLTRGSFRALFCLQNSFRTRCAQHVGSSLDTCCGNSLLVEMTSSSSKFTTYKIHPHSCAI